MSADREYTIWVRENDKFIQQENNGAYDHIAQILEDENSGIINLPEEIEAKNKEAFETMAGGQMEYLYTKEGYLLDFLNNVTKFDLINKYNAIDEDEVIEFLNVCEKYKDLPREDVLISYCVTY